MGTGNYSATANNMKLVHWLLMGGLLRLVQREGETGRPSPPLYNGPLLCGFNEHTHRKLLKMTKRITVYNKIHVTMLYKYNKDDK